ncbi:vacuolar protein sorting-associated protein 45 [Enteropsectra breve]|nr:vacuolar protein sorting-associated protein 45 [Enteropsectra breve]
MDSLFKAPTDLLLSRGTGIKAVLFDEESKRAISNIIPYSSFLDNDFFYFDYITNKERAVISDMACVVVIGISSIKFLIEELSSPKYSNYCVLFTNQIDPYILEILASSDTRSLISEVHEIYVGLCQQSPFLYTTSSDGSRGIADGLHSLLMSLEISPHVKVMISSNNTADSAKKALDAIKSLEDSKRCCSVTPARITDKNDLEGAEQNLKNIGHEIIRKAGQYSFLNEGTVVLLERNFDLFSPLMYDWHYQALIKEHLEYNNGIVKLNGKDYSVNDHFFKRNMFRDIEAVGKDINGMVEELERNKIKISNYQFEDIEEKAAHSLAVETHLSIYNELMEMCIANQGLSEKALGIVFGENKEFNREAMNSGSDKAHNESKLNKENDIRLALLYAVKNMHRWEEVLRELPEHKAVLEKFKECYEPVAFGYKAKLDSTRDSRLGYEPPLCRILRHICNGKINTECFESLNDCNERPGPVVFFINGGITMMEYRELMKMGEELKVKVYCISTGIINYREIHEKTCKKGS